MFRTLLIANRGEIARRIIRTARRLGVRTVAVYSDADTEALHVAEADQAIRIGAPPPKESYLDAEAVIAAAKAGGAEAVHPGYGFLSENAAFAEACAGAGLVFIGPSADAIRTMGEKDRAKAAVAAAGVPVIPGSEAGADAPESLIEAAERIGFPVLIKPIAGGGGRGLRVVERAADLAQAVEAARREVGPTFGDDRVMVEKRLDRPRHVEVQVFGDTQGRIVHLYERDCSIQRRYQKVIEESPAPGLAEDVRRGLHEAAIAAARAVDYVGAGTVEFLVDADGAFYFMEMNTRLQVEHPVTEMVTGLDLVEWQIRVAAGEPLPLSQNEVAIRGHAIEARLYAELDAAEALPATGLIRRFRLPPEGPHLRIDTGVAAGDTVTPYYDSMIAKLIAWGEDRALATTRLGQALDDSLVAGLSTNLAWLSAAIRTDDFRGARVDTGFVGRHRETLPGSDSSSPDDRLLALAALAVAHRRQGAAVSSPWADASGWQLNDAPGQTVRFVTGEGRVAVTLRGAPADCTLTVPHGTCAARIASDADDRLTAVLDGERVSALVAIDDHAVAVVADGRRCRIAAYDPGHEADRPAAAPGSLSAALPGTVTAILVEVGAAVARGTGLVIVEAMKVEHTVTAPEDGVVEAVRVKAGDRIAEGQELVVLKPAEGG